MASTITIQQTLNWALAFTVQRPNTGVGGIANEPGLTCANKVMQTMLAAPFRWPWNRKEVNFIAQNAGLSDYVQVLVDWGWLEKATYRLAGGSPPVKELEVTQVLAADTKSGPPQKVAPVFDDNAGNITIRLLPPPEQAYTIYLTYQKAPVLATALGSTWAPIPDRYAFLYELGMLAHLQGMYSPQLYALNMELFFKQLVGAAEGLTEIERAIFLEDKIRQLRMQQIGLIGAQQGRQARI